ncbi:MAG: CDGSH iron-sulfur domain-containing protein [Flavobacteriaceae bacterium]|nr:CDGSH iron-sulfur domain-containing protein [Flavobacteriaceae bacterium]
MNLPKRAGDTPEKVTLEAEKKYAWCSCGLSENQPFCDGKHKGTGLSPHIFTVETESIKNLCNCKATSNHPFCDGSHNK